MTITLPWRPVAIGGGQPISTSLTLAETEELAQLAKDAIVLEIGSAYGFSTIVMARHAKHVWAVDPHEGFGSMPDSYPIMKANLRAYDVEHRVKIVSPLATTVYVACNTCDMVFVDGDHRAVGFTRDIYTARHVLKRGGTLACHDYRETTCPDVKEVLDRMYPDGPDRLIDTLWIRKHG